jgi:rfaE bifunctional protein nucleotidyltransferase chain/domain
VRDPATKIRPREDLALLFAESKPGRVVLANGLFDLCHVGHARYLADARSRGDFLVVALNDDDSAAANKGAGRPLQPLGDRLLVIAAFRAVDAVTWFPERSVAQTLRLLRPRFHAKGPDYRPETLPADEQVAHRELGVEVIIAGDPKNHATSDLVTEILTRRAGGPSSGPRRSDPD